MVSSRLRSIGRRALDSWPAGKALSLLESLDRGRTDLLACLTYHRVATREDARGAPGLISATPAEFDEQMRLLSRRYRVVSLDDVLEAEAAGRPIGRRAVLVTFDDAHRDFLDHAWPVLRRQRVPVTLFVPTAFPGEPTATFWWDRLYDAIAAAPIGARIETPDGTIELRDGAARLAAYGAVRDAVKRRPHREAMELVDDVTGRQLGYATSTGTVISWADLERLAGDGARLAAHSRTHPLLDRIEVSELDAEIRGSFDDLVERVGSAPAAFAYPSGSWSPAVREATRRAGMRVAFTTRRGLNRIGRADWLTLRRINVGRASSANVLRAQLGRWAEAWS